MSQEFRIYSTLHPGVDAAAFHVDDQARFSIRQRHNLGNSVILLTVGRLQRRKGQDMIIRALPLIKHHIPNVFYLIVGSGEEEKYLRDLAATLGVAENVVFVGSIGDDERAAYYAACDVFVMPNREIDADIEGFGIVFLEAGAAGKPVIGGLSGGTADAIQDGITGLRVGGESASAIATAVIDLSIDTSRAQSMGRAGRQRVKDAFTWEKIVERTRHVAAAVGRGG